MGGPQMTQMTQTSDQWSMTQDNRSRAPMRWFVPALLTLSLAAGAGVRPASAQADAAAAAVLAATRAAMGGEAKLAGLKTMVITGRTRQLRGDNLVPIEFETNIEFPARYLRKDESPLEESDPTTAGFNGDELIQVPAPAAPAPARVAAIKADYTRWMLGVLGHSPALPLVFVHVGKAEAPQGKADVLDATGEGFAARLFISEDTHLPIMLTWQATAARGRGGRGGGGDAPAPPAEHRLFFSDYREVGGQQLPFRIRRAIGPDTVEETTVDRYRLNVKIDPRKFQPAR